MKNGNTRFAILVGDHDEPAEDVTVLSIHPDMTAAMKARDADIREALGYMNPGDVEEAFGELDTWEDVDATFVSNGHTFWKIVTVKS